MEDYQDKVKAVAKWLAMRFVYGRNNDGVAVNYFGLSLEEKEDAKKDAREILKLFPEYEPVQKAESIIRDEAGQWWITFSDDVKVSLNNSHNWVAEYVFSLLEPVELEALGDEELCAGCGVSDLRETMWASWCKQGKCTGYNERKEASQATIQKNQKGQLYRVKEKK